MCQRRYLRTTPTLTCAIPGTSGAEGGGHVLDDRVHAVEPLRARAEREVGDDELVEPGIRTRFDGVGAVVGGARARGATAGAAHARLGFGTVVGDLDQGMRGALDVALIAIARLPVLPQHPRPLLACGGQAPQVDPIGLAGR